MAVTDDLQRLAAQDVIYLSWDVGSGVTEVFRGRLRQALDGNWVFNTFTGQNGVVGFVFAGGQTQTWNSTETPVFGLQITIPFTVMGSTTPQYIVLSSLIPASFAD